MGEIVKGLYLDINKGLWHRVRNRPETPYLLSIRSIMQKSYQDLLMDS